MPRREEIVPRHGLVASLEARRDAAGRAGVGHHATGSPRPATRRLHDRGERLGARANTLCSEYLPAQQCPHPYHSRREGRARHMCMPSARFGGVRTNTCGVDACDASGGQNVRV